MLPVLQVLGGTNKEVAIHVSIKSCKVLQRWIRTVDLEISCRLSNNGVLTSRGEAVLAINLSITATRRVGPGPDVNVSLAVVPVRLCHLCISKNLQVVIHHILPH
jgi:hypothetical protein